jgi:hypothetical protein
MAIDKDQGRELRQIDALLDSDLLTSLPLPKATLRWVKDKLLGEGLKILRPLLDESRPPSFYVLGRSRGGDRAGTDAGTPVSARADDRAKSRRRRRRPAGAGGCRGGIGSLPAYRREFQEQYGL